IEKRNSDCTKQWGGLMSNSNMRVIRPALFCFLLAMLAGCGRVSLTWKEEVRLSDGQLITIDRTAKGHIQREIGGPTGWEPTEVTLQVQSVVDSAKAPPTWRSNLVPIVLDYDVATSTWVVVATYIYCGTWHKAGKPSSLYVEYISTNGGDWRVVPLESSRIGQASNLLVSIRHTGEPALIREAEKEVRRRRASNIYKAITPTSKNNC
ncbi:hypothetical protein JR064_13550, partial [Xanthomonas sp. CFBP 8703]